ncbi:hypothetical protein R3P38DRAFT_3272003 [Favolaschia claudopus]|uniref:C2H2-type domain-containing protein n=1 Tax=Favolaschia claudopus TaxID=2862362 RepID=A0AAW0B622_9AGAR
MEPGPPQYGYAGYMPPSGVLFAVSATLRQWVVQHMSQVLLISTQNVPRLHPHLIHSPLLHFSLLTHGSPFTSPEASAKADVKKRARRANNTKENEPVSDPIIVDNPQPLTRTTPTPIDISDDDSDSSDNEEESGRQTLAEHRFTQHKKNPAHVYRKASVELFSGKRSDKSVGGMWQPILGKKLDAARNAGLVVGTLTPSVVELWEKKGWRDLFTQRLRVLSFAAQPPRFPDVDDDEDPGSNDNVDPVLLAEERKAGGVPKTPAVKNPATVVSETKFTPASKFRTQVNNSLGNMSELVKVKMAAEERRVVALEAKLELDKEKLDLEKKRMEIDTNKGKVDMARRGERRCNRFFCSLCFNNNSLIIVHILLHIFVIICTYLVHS